MESKSRPSQLISLLDGAANEDPGRAVTVSDSVLPPERFEPAALHALVESARQAYVAGNLIELDRSFARALEQYPTAHWVHNEYAGYLRKTQRLPEAIVHYFKAHQNAPRSPDVLLNLVLALREAGDFPTAIDVLVRSLKTDPSDPRLWNQLGSCHRDSNDRESAQACFIRAIEINPQYLVATNNLANLLQDIGDYGGAVKLFERAVQIDASIGQVWINYGNCLVLMGRPRDATRAYWLAVQAAPDSSAAHFALNKAIIETGDRNEFLKSLAIYPGWASSKEMLSNVARLWAMAGDHDRAFELMREAIKVGPCTAEDWRDLAYAAIKRGRLDVARRSAMSSAAYDPEKISVLISAADILGQSGGGDEALALLAKIPESEQWRPTYVAARRSVQSATGRVSDTGDLSDVAVIRVSVPDSYPSVEALNDSLRELLVDLHTASHPPIGQSVYLGTQTIGSLWSRRDAALTALKGVLTSAVSDYLGERRLASRPYWAPQLPTFAFADGWSICVGKGGGHAEHYHPDGWISGVYYVSSPSELWRTPINGGWLKITADPESHAGEPLVSFPPLPGNLVLFPSYFRHSVTAQKVEGARIVVAFDVVPSSGRTG